MSDFYLGFLPTCLYVLTYVVHFISWVNNKYRAYKVVQKRSDKTNILEVEELFSLYLKKQIIGCP